MDEALRQHVDLLLKENEKLTRQLACMQARREPCTAAVVSIADVNAMQESDRERRQQYLQLLLENSPDIIILFDSSWRFAHCTNTFLRRARIPGLSCIHGKGFEQIFNSYADPVWVAKVSPILRKAVDAKIPLSFESLINIGSNGPRRYIVHFTPMIGMDGAVISSLMLLHDITTIREAQENAERARDAAERASAAKSEFLAKMSHEIRTPMNAIIGMAELALRENMPPVAYEHVLTIKQAGAHLLSIINDILDLSKIEAGNLEIVPGDYLFASLLNDVISIIRMRVLDSQIRFVVNIDCEIPNTLFGDEMRIRQILLNLLSNAVKYTESGFVSFSVIGDIRDDSTVNLTIEIEDSGKGIRQENIEKLFDAFVQIDLANNRGIEGTGLGLAITRHIIKAMGGDISVYSEYGKGSTFTVMLPQKFRTRKKLASVENPQDKSVLVYELREIFANSIVCTADNLGVQCKLVVNDDEFYERMTSETYSFVFVATALLENAKKILKELGLQAQIVLLTEFGEVVADKNLSILAMPVHSISVANILNGVSDGFTYGTGEKSVARFIAPDAKILVVDDINTNLKVAEGLLLPYNMQIDLCKSGMEAIVAVQAKRYDVVLMDHMMPEMDGMEATSRIRALDGEQAYYKDLPIIALTANAVAGAKELFLQKGFDDFLSKPIETAKLDAVLQRWIPAAKQHNMPTGNGITPENAVGTAISPKIDGMDSAAGMARAGGSPDRYRELLQMFLKDVETGFALLNAIPDGTSLHSFTTFVHALKSGLANIGANSLAKSAAVLEHAGRNRDLAAIRNNLVSFREELVALMARIGDATAAAQSACRENAPAALVRETLAGLQTALEAKDTDGMDIALAKLKNLPLTPKAHATVADIAQHVLFGNFKKAAEAANALWETAILN